MPCCFSSPSCRSCSIADSPPAGGNGAAETALRRKEFVHALRLTDRIYEHPAFPRAQAAAHFLASTLELVATRTHQFLQRAAPVQDLMNLRDFVTASSAAGALLERCNQLKDFFDRLTGADETVKWIEGDYSRKSFQLRLSSAPLDVGPHLEQRLFKKLDSCVLTSATLAVARDFHYIRARRRASRW